MFSFSNAEETKVETPPKGRRATPEGCIATAAGARAEEGTAEKYGSAISWGYGLKSVLGPYCEIVLVCQKLPIQRIAIAVDHRTHLSGAQQHTC